MRSINKSQVLIGVMGLLFGSLVYLIDRPPDQTYFVCSSPIKITLFNTVPNVFGFIGGSLPECVHVFSFILITAGLVFYGKKGYLIICLGWFLLDSAFEVGQKFATWSAQIIPDWFTSIPLLENTQNYFLQGTFDLFDLAAIALGATMAWFVLLATGKRGVMS